MNWHWYDTLNIHNKIITVVLFTLILLSVLIGILMWDSLHQAMDNELEKRCLELGKHVAFRCADDVLADDRYSLYELVNEMKRNEDDISYLFIIDSQNRVLAHTFSTGIPSGLMTANPAHMGLAVNSVILETSEGIIHDTIVPIENGSIGFVRVGMSEEKRSSQINARMQKLIIISLLVCILAIMLVVKMTVKITRPVSRLAMVAQEISNGNLSVNVPKAGADEVGKLATAFQDMTASLLNTKAERDTLLTEVLQKEQLRKTLISKLLTAQEDERKRISRELHDETGQALITLMMSMRVTADKAENENQRSILLGARDVAANTLRDIRTLAVELRPPALDDLGLIAAMSKYLDQIRERHSITIESDYYGDGIIEKETALALYRIMQESLTNVIKHSHADKIQVVLQQDERQVKLIIRDNGKGFHQDALDQAQRENRIGIYGMMERAELFGGNMEISSNPGNGTSIVVVIPNHKEEISS